MPARQKQNLPGHIESMERMSTGGPRHGGEAESRSVYSNPNFIEGEGFDENFGEVGETPMVTPTTSSPLQQLLERFKGSSDWLKLGLIGLAVVGLYIGLDESRKKKFFS